MRVLVADDDKVLTTEADEARVTELGAVAFLRKPVDAQTLHDTLSHAAGRAP